MQPNGLYAGKTLCTDGVRASLRAGPGSGDAGVQGKEAVVSHEAFIMGYYAPARMSLFEELLTESIAPELLRARGPHLEALESEIRSCKTLLGA